MGAAFLAHRQDICMRRFSFLILALCLQGATLVCAQAQPGYLPGKFVRADLLTNDLTAVKAFYGSLFGWQFATHTDRAAILAGERELGSIFQRDLPPDDVRKPRWIAYMSVPDVNATQQVVSQHGGSTLLAPREVVDLGTLAVFSDAEGAVFGAVHLTVGDPEDYMAEPGEWIWLQLLSRDAVKAGEFYARLAPYELFDDGTGEGGGSLLLASDGYARAALKTIPADRAELKPAWLPFVRVANITQATGRVQQLGGKVLVQPRPALFDGKVAVIADPTGAALGILEWQYEESPREISP
jgi:predicted enzyme related to lactoylglutathione lyase